MLLIAPDSFKGTYDAASVATAIARGVGCACDLCPVADGGEGTLEILVAADGGLTTEAAAHDALGRPLRAPIGWIDDGRTAIVEVAHTAGLGLVAAHERDAEVASTRGTGEMIAAAVAAGPRHVVVALGGSATSDGGAGAIAEIDRAGGMRGVELILLADVRTPFEQAAVVYGPQKGADAAAVARLTARLEAQAARLERDPRGIPMTGSAGGLSGGLWATYGAHLVPGAAWVLDRLDFGPRLARAAAVITGEGRLDAQTLEGKAVGEIAARARRRGVPLHVVAGSADLSAEQQGELGLASLRIATDEDEMAAAGAGIVSSMR